MANKTKKTIYVNKYDYMHYYTRCKEVWFVPNAKIDKLITNVETPLKDKLGIKDDLDDDEEENEDGLIDYEAMQEAKLNGAFDDQKILQEKDLKILEGLIIDKQAKDFIIDHYQRQVTDDFICVIDYDEINSNQKENTSNPNENKDINLSRANQTQKDIKELLDKNKKFILFQPTFIAETPDNHAKYVTRCDCIVYLSKDQCYLIEVKGTSSSKLIHLLDLLYQKNVLKQSILHITNYCLCLVEYDRSDKKDIPFIIDPFINTSKSNKNLSDGKKNYFDLILDHAFNESDPKELKKKLKNVDEMEISLKQNYKLGKEHLLINNALNND
ncbi:hypothetical protein J6P59_07800 [bacterium]|nr:hypothetical protein [bacterium]